METQPEYQARRIIERKAEIAAANATPSIKQIRFDAIKAKAAAKREAIAAAMAAPVQSTTTETRLATEAQVSYLESLLPRYNQISCDDGVGLDASIISRDGVVNFTSIRSLTKTEASEWITQAKEEIAAS